MDHVDDYRDLAARVRTADATRQRAYAAAAAHAALAGHELDDPRLTAALAALDTGRAGDRPERAAVGRFVEELDELAWDERDRGAAEEYHRAFQRARVAGAVEAALDGDPATAAEDAAYEAGAALEDDPALRTALEAVLEGVPGPQRWGQEAASGVLGIVRSLATWSPSWNQRLRFDAALGVVRRAVRPGSHPESAGYEAEPGTFLPDDLGDPLFAASDETLGEIKRRVLALGVQRIDVPDERFRAVWAAVGAGEHPTIAEARGLRALAQALADASAAVPDDAGAWERAELAEALVGALDTDPFAAAYQATRSVHPRRRRPRRRPRRHDARAAELNRETSPERVGFT